MPWQGSFRWRVFIVTMATVGLAMGAVLWVGGQQALSNARQRLDERLCMEGRRLADPGGVAAGRERWERLGPDIAQKLQLHGAHELRMRVRTADGSVALQSPGPWPEGGGVAEADAVLGPADPRGACTLSRLQVDGSSWHLARVHGRNQLAELAADPAALSRELRGDLLQALARVAPLALLLAALCAWLLSGMTVRPLLRLQASMRRIRPQALDERLPTAREDREFRALIDTYNTMLDRLEASFHQASRFSADAAHELRTPLTILQGKLEQAIRRTEGRAVQEELGEVLEEVARLATITRRLLMLSQADAGQLPVRADTLDLSDMLQDLMADAPLLDDEVPLHSSIQAGLQVRGDAALLRQVFNNLLSNALRHGTRPGWVRVRAAALEQGVEVVFSNHAPPLDAIQRSQFFQRFFRADAARSRQVDGTGLGLSLVREIVRAHGGEAQLLPSAEDEVHLRVWLPR
ncbi:ATP-binding protein [Roseateles sp. BYS87W]|uniref:histidine kinase n=1 Tax=Pelomonas baiyunensis TaxID=3299026 RepID=A0ABW7H0Q6_9BURK